MLEQSNVLVWSESADWDTCARDGGIAIGDDAAVRLAASHLITHEPGAFSTQHGEELFQNVQTQVSFVLGGTLPQRVDCYFYAREEQNNPWPLLVTVNGHTKSVGPGTLLAGEFAWRHVRIPQVALVPGENFVRFACESPAANAWILSVDTSVPSAHSRKSTDGGRSWHATGLGLEGALSGEYVVRLRVREHPARGVITSPEINVAAATQRSKSHTCQSDGMHQDGSDKSGHFNHAGAELLALQWHTYTPPGTKVMFRYRSGDHVSLEHLPWVDVNAATSTSEDKRDSRPVSGTGQAFRGNDGLLQQATLPSVIGPYVQWQAVLTSESSTMTPSLQNVALGAKGADSVTSRPACALTAMEGIIAPSYSFTYQDPTEPKLDILRKQERLDEIIASATTQWEQMLALRSWVAVQWVHRAPHEFRRCCPWDALTILAWMRADRGHGQPEPDAYCTHYAVVLAQCALALGWPARLWVMSAEPTLHDNGHFVAEIWSTAHDKWVMLDADTDSHVERTGVPQSVLEIHDAWRDDALDQLHVIPGANADKVKIGPDWIEEMLPLGLYRFCGLVLRNNHLSTLIPGPVEHGWTTYKWDGFLWWRDGSAPELPFFSLSSNRRADFDWRPED